MKLIFLVSYLPVWHFSPVQPLMTNTRSDACTSIFTCWGAHSCSIRGAKQVYVLSSLPVALLAVKVYSQKGQTHCFLVHTYMSYPTCCNITTMQINSVDQTTSCKVTNKETGIHRYEYLQHSHKCQMLIVPATKHGLIQRLIWPLCCIVC